MLHNFRYQQDRLTANTKRMNIEVEYELDQWEWQGTKQSIEVDSDDFEGMSDVEIRDAVYREICRDGQQKMHFVYPESEIADQIKNALAEEEGQST